MKRPLPRAALLTLVLACASACTIELPEEGAPQTQLYRARCSVCHPPYQPRVMTPTMWEVTIGRMEQRMREAGKPPLTRSEREQILDYLSRHGGGR